MLLPRAPALLIALLCSFTTAACAQQTPTDYAIEEFGPAPHVPTGPISPELERALRVVFVDSLEQSVWGEDQQTSLAEIAASDDPRLAWVITDMMRFTWRQSFDDALADAAASLMEKPLQTPNRWGEVTDHLIAWDIPAYPGYLDTKRAIFTHFVPGWERIFAPGEIDWRLVSWGGVPPDARPFGTTDDTCNCIPAADNPEVQPASEATWLDDDDTVFGIEINGEARAYPRQIMEVREMVNDTLGGRDLGIPYCTLCGAAQAYFTDGLPAGVKRPTLRTSGLLIRSNKVMFDLETYSVFDTFLGTAVTGPLAKRGITLEQATVITTEWGEWKKAHPDTTVLVERLALGRDFDFRNGRDANGPIFPVGDVDPRLPVQEDIIGVIAPSGKPTAFQRTAAMLALSAGESVSQNGIVLQLDAGGIRAEDTAGNPLPSHQAFWFAWSQFHDGTGVWRG
ncbi:DUF3179 domain-containing protein [Sulfitobacter albidus]|uniref:DUF3179 domain-containing protein n=1 Tax=Sulfitobacter albidus TaxID=2829501 RepID=A0A975JE96_9RHOB|nr:DUF3179 domain-containing (seleno)protein [Sulfitobacter albidus]QUJ76843.1 DUF3179 domain-containing protein [Sulfitobacter albidus]